MNTRWFPGILHMYALCGVTTQQRSAHKIAMKASSQSRVGMWEHIFNVSCPITPPLGLLLKAFWIKHAQHNKKQTALNRSSLSAAPTSPHPTQRTRSKCLWSKSYRTTNNSPRWEKLLTNPHNKYEFMSLWEILIFLITLFETLVPKYPMLSIEQIPGERHE